MRLTLEVAKAVWQTGETISVRLIVLNDDYSAVTIDRRLLVGPNLEYTTRRMPRPVQVEPAFDEEHENQVVLNSWSLYGRERTFTVDEPGDVRMHGYLLRHESDGLLAAGPVDAQALLLAAEPLQLTIGG